MTSTGQQQAGGNLTSTSRREAPTPGSLATSSGRFGWKTEEERKSVTSTSRRATRSAPQKIVHFEPEPLRVKQSLTRPLQQSEPMEHAASIRASAAFRHSGLADSSSTGTGTGSSTAPTCTTP